MKIILKNLQLLVILGLGYASLTDARAEESKTLVYVTGSVTKSPCELDLGNTTNRVIFQEIKKSHFNKNKFGGEQNISIKLKRCDPKIAKNTQVLFTGIPDSTLSGSLAISGEASGVAISLFTRENQPIVLGEKTPKVALEEGSNDLFFKAKLESYPLGSEHNPVQPGHFSAVLNFLLEYS